MSVLLIGQGGKVHEARAIAIDRVLTYFEESERFPRWVRLDPDCNMPSKVASVGLEYFDGADLTVLYESLASMNSNGDDLFGYKTIEDREQLASLPWSWDLSSAIFDSEDAGAYADRGYLLTLHRDRTIPISKVRGLFRPMASVCVERTIARLLTGGVYSLTRQYWQYYAKSWKKMAAPLAIRPTECCEGCQTSLWAHRSLALSKEYQWKVNFWIPQSDGPSVSVEIDPVSAKEVFKLREVSRGKSRKDALKHWVSAHYRRQFGPTHAETYIWPYLRGAEQFEWEGLHCNIIPSQYDLRKAKEYQLKKQAKAE